MGNPSSNSFASSHAAQWIARLAFIATFLFGGLSLLDTVIPISAAVGDPYCRNLSLSTGLALLLGGFILWVIYNSRHPWGRYLCHGLACPMLMLTWPTLVGYPNPEMFGACTSQSMAATIILSCLALYCLYVPIAKYYKVAEFFLLFALSIIFSIILAHFAEPNWRHPFNGEHPLVPAVGFLALFLGIVAVRPQAFSLVALVSGTSGGFVMRRFLPIGILVTVVIGWLSLSGYSSFFQRQGQAFSLMTLIFLTAFSLLFIRHNAEVLDRLENERIQAENALYENRKQLEDSLRQRAHELLEADRRKDEFLAMLAHELRNPLAPIRNAAQILRLKTSGASDLQKYIEMIDRQSRHLTQLVDDLLDVSRIARGKVELQIQEIELTAVVAHAVEALSPLIKARQHQLIVIFPPKPVFLMADAVRLAQVVENLLNNAAKYTPDGGEIKLVVQREDSAAILRVSDNGIGIAPEMVPQIFDFFVQADQGLSRSQGGLGIGLALVRRFVEMHGGSVEAFSLGPNQGSEFIVRLPTLGPDALPGAGSGRNCATEIQFAI